MSYSTWLPEEQREKVKIVGMGYYCFKKSGKGAKLVPFNPNLMIGA